MEEYLKLIPCEEKYWEFIRNLRIDKRNLAGFIKTDNITREQQIQYMQKYNKFYYICLFGNIPVGFIGQINDDIRVCVSHEWKGKGIATFMVKEFIKIYPNSLAKVKIDNIVSNKLFTKCGFKPKYIIYEL